MGKMKCKIDQLDKNQRYKLETVLDILMTLDYSNALSSSNDKLCAADSTFNNNSSDSDKSNKITEIIPPSPKWHRRYLTRIRNKLLLNGKKCRKHVNAKSLESGTHEILDTNDTQNIQPISTTTMETSQSTSTEHDHDHDDVQISTSSKQIVTIQVETLTTTVESSNPNFGIGHYFFKFSPTTIN